ncbi:Sugar phosphate isomerase/epimerase [Haladaptatus litoreus]|uniref:Sugar phosphate isomerase/epimerase n=1 Tax=Haladaptatus litoreus TaxID=553468 RepID=A0A1N7DGI3_9EURY|nr:sugar phosphate isomerase/epimerase [Haladaptatus litoreus]SIR74946.1 Sugar phosphate isomerase/epimerase [Haladaptatus litoreus]
MHIGLCTISDKETSVETVLSRASSAGYDGVEIWGNGHVDRSGKSPQTVRQETEKLGLEIPVYGSYLRPGTSEFDDAYANELAIAADLNADLIRVWAGDQEYGNHDSAHWNQVVTDLQELATAASDRNIGVTVEKHEGTLTNATEGAQRLIKTVDEPNCGLNWQPLFGMEADTILMEARELASMSNNIHTQAVSSSGRNTRCALEDAFFDIEGCLEIFQAAGFDGYVNVEFVRSDTEYTTAIKEDLEYLRSVGI